MTVKAPCTIESADSRTVYVVRVNSDLTEGRGYQYVKHVTQLRATALRLAHGEDVQGSDGYVHEANAYLIGGQWYAPVHIERPTSADEKREAAYLAETEKAKRRDSALERARALGLSEEDLAALGVEKST